MIAYGASAILVASKPTPNQLPAGPDSVIVAVTPSCAIDSFTRPPRLADPASLSGGVELTLVQDFSAAEPAIMVVVPRPKHRSLDRGAKSVLQKMPRQSASLPHPARAWSGVSQVHCPWNSPVQPNLGFDGRQPDPWQFIALPTLGPDQVK